MPQSHHFMDRLWAIKKDYDPFPPGVFLQANLFAAIRCTVYRCPYCRRAFKVTWGPTNSMLGSGERTCWHCGQVFCDGSQEWPEMNSGNRLRFVMPISVAGFFGAFMVIGGLYTYFDITKRRGLEIGALIFFSAFSLPIACWIILRILQIVRSIRRYNNRGSVGTS